MWKSAKGGGAQALETLNLFTVSSASASSAYDSSYAAANAFNGVFTQKGWVPSNTDSNRTLRADLGSSKSIKGIVVGFVGTSASYSYNEASITVQYSSNDSSYTTFGTFTLKAITYYYSQAFIPVDFDARYVRLAFNRVNNYGIKASFLGAI